MRTRCLVLTGCGLYGLVIALVVGNLRLAARDVFVGVVDDLLHLRDLLGVVRL